jgi:TatD DNase family protein
MPQTKLIDCHLHLQDDCFAGDLPAVIKRAKTAGVALMVCNGSCQSDWPTVLTLARSNPDIIPSFGLHPWYAAGRATFWLAELRHFLTAIPSGVGEIGLDRWLEDRSEKAQEDVFRAQLMLAAEMKRPVTIHCVKAWGWMFDILRSHHILPDRMLLHSYGGSVELIKPLASMGAYFSYAGNLLRDKAIHRREALAATPMDRLLLETDSPDIIPPRRYCLAADGVTTDGKPRNEPANLAGIVDGAASLLKMEPSELRGILHDNARDFFGSLINRNL